MDFAVSLFPILLLIWLLTKRNAMASHVALPLVAALIYALQFTWFEADPNQINATVVNGVLAALTPITIIWGAIFLFKTMELSGGMDVVRTWLNGISQNRVAQLMIIAWAFGFLIEGASGFGTPAALAAPILVGLGFAPLKVALVALVMNSVPVSFGAVGTPTWFGMEPAGVTEAEMLRIGLYSAIMHAAAATFIPLMALRFAVSWADIRRNIVFIYLSVAACVVPYVLLAAVNYEFPALIGGAVGLGISIVLSKAGIGLARGREDDGDTSVSATGEAAESVSMAQVVRATFPLWGTIVILLVTRIQQLGIKGLLNATSPSLETSLGTFAELDVSAALVVSLRDIFGVAGPDGAWSYSVLYVPALIPFFFISFVSFAFYRLEGPVVRRIFSESWDRMVNTIKALVGALIMVRLMMAGGEDAIVQVLGRTFADTVGTNWQYFASLLGALGSFFSGSATISNLTFSGIQASIADTLGLDRVILLSLQSVGAAMGNMVCINNIVAVCTIIGVVNREGYILTRTVLPMMLYALMAAVVSVFLPT